MKPVSCWRPWFVTLFVATLASAAPVKVFKAQSAEAFARGDSDGVAIDAAGVLALAPAAERLAAIDEPFAYALAQSGNRWAVATGADGKLIAIDAQGGSTILLDVDESHLFALAAEADGTLWAGSSPDGKLYRVAAAGASEVWFDPPELYLWAVARGGDGALWVATGAPGRLYRLTGKEKSEQVWEGASHVRSLLALANGDLLFGTAGDGRLLRWRAGSVRTLYDSELAEVAALAAGADGSIWMALVASEASFVDLSQRPAAESGAEPSKAAIAVEEATAAVGSRPPGSQGARSELVRLLPSGATETVWSSTDETLFALQPDGDRIWAATGLEGRLYQILPDGSTRVERKFEERQLVALAAGTEGPLVLTTNAASLWRLGGKRVAAGSYTSAALDTGQVARFGLFRWQGELPSGSAVRASFRSGFSAEPDATWSAWSEPLEGGELSLAALERGRFVQWRLELAGAPRVVSTELTYRQENLRPIIQSFGALDPGQILVPAGFNPADQLYEPASPNREGIFDTLRPSSPKPDRLRTLWRRGWLTLKWEATDPNGDSLEARVEVRPEGRPDGWLQLGDELGESQFAFDATALPDGLYRFRLTVSDAPGNESGAGVLTRVRDSEPVVVDQTPPETRSVARRGDQLRVAVYDAWNPLRQAEVSVDGAEWRAVQAADGLLDGKSEELVVTEVPPQARLVLLRLIDAAFNVRTVNLADMAVDRP